MIRPELAQRPEFRARFAREAESARRVRRFTTAAVLDAEAHGPQPYLVTEFVEGPTLSRHVSVREPMRPADLEQLAVSVTTALSAIHAAGIVHRDLTPGNVLLSPVGPKVIDFGLAREFNTDTELSRNVRQAIGTPGYMSPEQILDAPITSAVDIFSWGAVMVFAATGQPPFGTGRMEAILYRIINEPPRLDGVSGELRGLIEVAMAKEAGARPSAEELRTALIGGGALPARPAPVAMPAETAAAQPRRWGRHGRGAAAPTPATPPLGTASFEDAAGRITQEGFTSAAMPATQLSPAPLASPPPVPPRTPPPGGSPVPVLPPGAPPARLRRRRRTLVLAGAFAVLLAAAVAIPVIVLGGDDEPGAANPAERAAASTRLATDAAARRAQDPQLAARLSLAAYAIAPTAAARDALIASFGQSTSVRVPAGTSAYSDLTLSPDGTTLAGTDDAGRLHLWRLDADGRPTVAAQGSAGYHASGVVFDSSGRTLATGGATDAGRLWDVSDPTRPRMLGALGAQSTPVHRLALSTKAHLLATAGVDWSVGLWDVTDPGRPTSLQLLIGRSGPVTGVALRPDGAVLAIAGVGGTVQLWNVRDPRHPAQMGSVPGHTGAVNTVAFSPDGRMLATGGDDRNLQVSDVADPNHPRVAKRLPGHAAPVTTVAFASGDQLLSADSAGSVAYSNLAVSAPALIPMGAVDSPVRAMSATAAGSVGTILLGTLDPPRLRQGACAKPGAALSRAEWSRLVPGIPWYDACAS